MPVIATVLTSKKFSSVSDLEHGVCSWVYHPAEGDNLSGKQGYFKAEIPRFRLLSDVISKVPEGEQLLLTLRCLEVGWAGASRSFSVAEGSCHRACGNAAPSVPAWQSTKFYPNGAGFRLNLYGRLANAHHCTDVLSQKQLARWDHDSDIWTHALKWLGTAR